MSHFRRNAILTAVVSAALVVGVVTPAYADGGAASVSLTVNSVGRDVTSGNLTWDVTAEASNFQGNVCADYSFECHLEIDAVYPDGSSSDLTQVNIDNLTTYSSELSGSNLVAQISGIREVIFGPVGSASTLVAVTDPYPTPVVSASINSYGRDDYGDVVYDVTASASYFGLPGYPCYYAYMCDFYIESEYADGSTRQLSNFEPISAGSYPATRDISGTVLAPVPQITHIRAVVYGSTGFGSPGFIHGPWISVVDLSPTESIGGSNPAEKNCGCSHGDPINTATGEFYQSATDDGIPGVGPGLQVARTYSSVNAAVNGPFGYGWAASFDSQLDVMTVGTVSGSLPPLVQIVQENGATVQFALQSDGTYAPPPRVLATLTNDPTTGDWTFTRNKSQIMIFNSSGQLTALKDLNGNTVTVGYTSGNVTSLTASGGREIDLTWSSGHVTGLSDSAGRSVSYSYDGSGDLTSVTAVDSAVTSYAYNSFHYMTSFTKPDGGTTTNYYDNNNRVYKQIDPLGRTTIFQIVGLTTTTTLPDGSQTVEVFNQGRVVSQTKDAGTSSAATTLWTYDDAGDVLTVSDPLGDVTTSTYDGSGNQLTKIDALGHTTTWTYNGLNEVLSETDPLGRETTSTYDSAGNETSTTSPSGRVQHRTYNSNGTVASFEDARGKTTTYSYNTAGDRTGVTDPDSRSTSTGYNSAGFVTSTTDAAGKVTSDTVDAAGRVLTVTDPNSHTTTYTYDSDGNRTSVEDAAGHTTSSTYDADDELTSTTDARGKTTTYTYTDNGYPETTTDPDSHTTTKAYNLLGELTSVTDGNGHVTSYAYDADGRKLSTTLPSGAESTVTYNADGEVTASTDAAGHTTSYSYDADGETTSVTDPLSRVTHTSYTADGQVHVITLPDLSTETYTYNADGQPTEFTNADGKNTTYSYDDAGLLTSKTEPGGLTTSYTYDAAGRPDVTTKPDATTVTDGYDNAGQLTSVDYSASSSSDVTYTYNSIAERTGMTDSTGTSSYSYNADGQLTSETNGAGTTIGYGYDNAGLLTSITYPGSHTVTYGYDDADQMTSLTDWNSNTTSFTWTSDGELSTQADPNGVTQTRSYNANDQTTGISAATSSSTLATYSYGYDAAGELTSDGTTDPILTGTTHTYTYNTVGQLSSTATGSGSPSDYSSTSGGELTGDASGDTLAYNNAQELTSLTPVSGPAVSYGYDNNGSRTSSDVAASGSTPEADTAYSYDPAGDLATVTLPGATSASVSYTSDGDGLRQARATGTTTTDFLWDTQSSIPLLLDDGTHSYLYGPSTAPIAQIDDSNNTIQYLVGDLVGSTRVITNSSGSVVGTTEYDPYGNRTSHTGTADSAIGYSGNWTDPTTGFVYLRARDYDPATAQFLTVDPAVDTTNQPYAYVTDDPLTATDALGLCPVNGGPNVPDCTAADFDPVLNVFPWLGSPQASAVSYGLTHGVTGDVSSALVGLGDGASFGLTSTLTQALYPEADCEIRSNSGFYYGGQLAGAIGSTVATAGIAGAGGGAAEAEEAVDGAAEDGSSLMDDAARAEQHLTRLDPSPANDAMIARIRSAATDGRPLDESESNFLTHELTESDLMDSGMDYPEAHDLASQTHPTFANYHPDVIDQFPELFNNNWRAYWGLPPR